MRNLLIIGSKSRGSLEDAYERALRRVGAYQVEFFATDNDNYKVSPSSSYRRARARIVANLARHRVARHCRAFLEKRREKYDAVLVFKGAEFSRGDLETYRCFQPNAIWLNLNPDDPLNVDSPGSTNTRIVDSLSFFDIYLTWSRRLMSKLKSAGCKSVEYLPFGYDRDFHSPPSNVTTTNREVSFFGAWDREREAVLKRLVDFELSIFGNGWDRAKKNSQLNTRVVAKNIYGNDLSILVFTSGVSLNLLRRQNVTAHNMRTFEIPAMGGLMITNRSDEQQEYFPDEEGCLMFDDTEELRYQIRRALDEKGLTSAIRTRSRCLVQSHSYDQRARRLVEMIRNA